MRMYDSEAIHHPGAITLLSSRRLISGFDPEGGRQPGKTAPKPSSSRFTVRSEPLDYLNLRTPENWGFEERVTLFTRERTRNGPIAVSPGICFEETQQPALFPQPSPAKTAVLHSVSASRRPDLPPCGWSLSR